MNKETFSFELVDKDKPEIVIKNSLRQIDEATRGYVKGNIEKYDGQIRTYKKKRKRQIRTCSEIYGVLL